MKLAILTTALLLLGGTTLALAPTASATCVGDEVAIQGITTRFRVCSDGTVECGGDIGTIASYRC